VNTLTAQTGGAPDRIDYLTFTLPAGSELSSLTLKSFAGPDRIAFIGIMNGGQFTESASNPTVENMLGWAHFGLGEVGDDLLPGIGEGFGSQGFVPPLPSGTYSVWLQQQGGRTSYQLEWLVSSEPVGVPGDFDMDGSLTAADIDSLRAEVRAGTNTSTFDVNGDNVVNSADRTHWISELKKTYVGDSNLDNEFNSTDFVLVFTAGQYEDTVPGNSTWATGDWNGDADFNSADFVAAFTEGGYEKGPRPAANSVPEPGLSLLIAPLVAAILWHRRTRKSGTRKSRPA
jgi:hypothetical protein